MLKICGLQLPVVEHVGCWRVPIHFYALSSIPSEVFVGCVDAVPCTWVNGTSDAVAVITLVFYVTISFFAASLCLGLVFKPHGAILVIYISHLGLSFSWPKKIKHGSALLYDLTQPSNCCFLLLWWEEWFSRWYFTITACCASWRSLVLFQVPSLRVSVPWKSQ